MDWVENKCEDTLNVTPESPDDPVQNPVGVEATEWGKKRPTLCSIDCWYCNWNKQVTEIATAQKERGSDCKLDSKTIKNEGAGESKRSTTQHMRQSCRWSSFSISPNVHGCGDHGNIRKWWKENQITLKWMRSPCTASRRLYNLTTPNSHKRSAEQIRVQEDINRLYKNFNDCLNRMSLSH